MVPLIPRKSKWAIREVINFSTDAMVFGLITPPQVKPSAISPLLTLYGWFETEYKQKKKETLLNMYINKVLHYNILPTVMNFFFFKDQK